jgi:ATP-binding protein involved in chromosome partitioning
MARNTNLRIVGVVENMSGDVFGTGGGDALANELGVQLLGRVPLDPSIREQGDLGQPIVSALPESSVARTIVEIAETIDTRREPGSIIKSLPLVS